LYDVSKDGNKIVPAISLRLSSASSIFSAEAIAVLLALEFVASSDESKIMACSDSFSCLLAMASCETENSLI
jgi:hypothetical protein